LWLLARQWQFNEFQGEDAGTPLRVSFSVAGTAVDAFRSGGDAQQQPWQPLMRGEAPIREPRRSGAGLETHPRLRGDAGLHALRMSSAALRAALLTAYPLTLDPPTDPVADQAGLLWSTLVDRRTVDGAALALDLQPLLDGAGALTALPAAIVVDAGEVDAAKTVLAKWLAWFRAFVFEGNADNPSWLRNRMEYAFALKAGDLALTADEYTDGHVDWDDFSLSAVVPNAQPIQHSFAVATRHPTPVIYPGMPAERYWEFEDGNVNFAGAEAGITDSPSNERHGVRAHLRQRLVPRPRPPARRLAVSGQRPSRSSTASASSLRRDRSPIPMARAGRCMS